MNFITFVSAPFPVQRPYPLDEVTWPVKPVQRICETSGLRRKCADRFNRTHASVLGRGNRQIRKKDAITGKLKKHASRPQARQAGQHLQSEDAMDHSKQFQNETFAKVQFSPEIR